MHLGLKNGPFVPHTLTPVQGSPVPSLKFQMAPILKLLMYSRSKEKEPRYTCLSEARASHSQRMWAEVSYSAPHLLHKGLLVSPINRRRLLSVLCAVRWPISTLDCVLLRDKSLVFAAGLGSEINSQACLYILLRTRHLAKCWLSLQLFIFLYFA
jgi:hypothetical protein